MLGQESLTSENDEELQDVLMGHWNMFDLPLPDGILLCPLMVFMTEVILKSEDSLGNTVAVKNT